MQGFNALSAPSCRSAAAILALVNWSRSLSPKINLYFFNHDVEDLSLETSVSFAMTIFDQS